MDKVSVITVVRNDIAGIQLTLKSVLGQDYRGVEFLVFDGKSTDGTAQYIAEYSDRIDFWVSEKDEGIYDAMNKGIEKASGQWIIFMNSGDEFYSTGTLSDVFQDGKNEDCDIIYGNHMIKYSPPRKQKLKKAGEIRNIIFGGQFSHQASFVKASLLKSNPFDLSYKITADYNFFLQSWVKDRKFRKVDITIAKISPYGASDTNQLEVIRSWRQIVLNFAPESKSVKWTLHFFILEQKTIVFDGIKRVLKNLKLWPVANTN